MLYSSLACPAPQKRRRRAYIYAQCMHGCIVTRLVPPIRARKSTAALSDLCRSEQSSMSKLKLKVFLEHRWSSALVDVYTTHPLILRPVQSTSLRVASIFNLELPSYLIFLCVCSISLIAMSIFRCRDNVLRVLQVGDRCSSRADRYTRVPGTRD